VREPMSETLGRLRGVLDRKHVAGGGPCDLPAWKHHRVDGGAAISAPNHVWRAGIKPSD